MKNFSILNFYLVIYLPFYLLIMVYLSHSAVFNQLPTTNTVYISSSNYYDDGIVDSSRRGSIYAVIGYDLNFKTSTLSTLLMVIFISKYQCSP